MARFGDGLAVDADLVVAAERAAAQALDALESRPPRSDGGLRLRRRRRRQPPRRCERAAGMAPSATVDRLLRARRDRRRARGRGRRARSASGAQPSRTSNARAFSLEVMPAESGMAVVGMPERQPDDDVAVLLADPWSFPVDGFVAQTNEALPGPADRRRDGGRARRPRLDPAAGRRPRRRARRRRRACSAGRSAPRTVVSQGCRPVGPAMTVTAADGNVILELAGSPGAAEAAGDPVDAAARRAGAGVARVCSSAWRVTSTSRSTSRATS